MKFSEIINYFELDYSIENDCLFNNISLSSKKIEEKDIFIAISGEKFDGRDFILDAINNGAKLIIAENKKSDKDIKVENINIPIIYINNLKNKLSDFAAWYYGNPAEKIYLIGITGTNGKTSVAHFVSNLLPNAKSIGTLTEDLTTPDCCVLQKRLKSFVDLNIKYVALEVSSHALFQDRIKGIEFHTVVFTNLTQDHLDYHKSMDEYWNAKLKLFLDYKYKNAVINIDCKYGKDLYEKIKYKNINILTYGFSRADIRCLSVESNNFTSDVVLETKFGLNQLNIPLVGNYNIHNILAVLAVAFTFNIDILPKLKKIDSVPGRLQLVKSHFNNPKVFIDYAHTDDALEKVLQTLENIKDNKVNLITVFGCGGDRDKSKRPKMLKKAEKYSSTVILTTDNPRTELQKEIFTDILSKGFNKKITKIITDRAEAIQTAVTNADKDDIILIAGKGHEQYQLIGTEKIYFSDFKTAAMALKTRGAISGTTG